MKGYYLFRGDLLIAYNKENTDYAGGLHLQGKEGDVLVFLGNDHIDTFKWISPEDLYPGWGLKTPETTDKYRLLVLLQK